MSIVFDIAVVAIVVLLVFLGYRRGFVRTALNLVGHLAAAVLAFLLSSPIADWIFRTFLRGSSVDLIVNGLSDMTAEQNLSEVVEKAFSAIPESIRTFAPEGAFEDVRNQLMQTVPTHSEIANTIVDQLVAPIATTILQLLLFLILFLLFCVVVKLVSRMLKIIDKLPLIGSINSTLGLVVGLAEAVVFLAFFTGIVAMLIQMSGNQWAALNQDVVDQTFIFKYIYEYNPLIQLK